MKPRRVGRRKRAPPRYEFIREETRKPALFPPPPKKLPMPLHVPSPEKLKALEELETSVRNLRIAMENPRAHQHHLVEAAQAAETDARWLTTILQKEMQLGA